MLFFISPVVPQVQASLFSQLLNMTFESVYFLRRREYDRDDRSRQRVLLLPREERHYEVLDLLRDLPLQHCVLTTRTYAHSRNTSHCYYRVCASVHLSSVAFLNGRSTA